EPGLFSGKHVALLKTFADQAVIAVENVRLFNETKEALEQQTATAEILRVISSSPTDVQPVFDTIVRSATRLCRAVAAAVFVTDGRTLYEPSNYGGAPEALAAARARYPRPLDRETASGTAILTRSVVHVPDVQEPSATEFAAFARRVGRDIGFRSLLSVPMLREGEAVGAINVTRSDPGLFSDTEVALLKTFADQAVIAIENVRLFNETKDALERQTATSEILQLISQSPTDTQPVLEGVVERALRLSEATAGAVSTFDGELIHVVASNLAPDSPILRVFPMPPSRTGSLAARTVFERQIIHVPDVLAEPGYNVSQQAAESGYRSVLSVPMLREGTVLGTITVGRSQAGPYLDRQIALLKTFADQAVIAIENVRLFNETKEALERQTATSEILSVISSSPTDVQPVFEAIVRSASHLCNGEWTIVTRYDGELIHLVAQHNAPPGPAGAVERLFPSRPARNLASARAILEGAVVHIPDANEDAGLAPGAAALARSFLSVPMLREGVPIGAITTSRATAGPFAPEQIAL